MKALAGWLAYPRGGSLVIDGSIRYSSVYRISPQGAIFRRVCSVRRVLRQTLLVCVFVDVSRVAGAYRSLTVRAPISDMILVPFERFGHILCHHRSAWVIVFAFLLFANSINSRSRIPTHERSLSPIYNFSIRRKSSTLFSVSINVARPCLSFTVSALVAHHRFDFNRVISR